MSDLTPMSVEVPQSRLQDLSTRLKRAHLPEDYANADWAYGTNGDYLHRLVDYWIHGFDWRQQERAMNTFSHFKVGI